MHNSRQAIPAAAIAARMTIKNERYRAAKGAPKLTMRGRPQAKRREDNRLRPSAGKHSARESIALAECGVNSTAGSFNKYYPR